MNFLRVFAITLLLAALAAADAGQRKRAERTAGEEQAVTRPGVLSRQGDYWVEELSGSVPAAPRVRVKSPAGDIDLRGAAQQEITYRIHKRVSAGSEESARRKLAEYPIVVRRRGDLVELAIDNERGNGFSAHFNVTVPKSTAAAELDTRGGNIGARDLDGSLRAQTAGGNIEADGIGGEADVQTAGGGVTLKTMRGGVKAQTAGGNVKLGYAGGDAHLATAGGNIEVGQTDRSVRAQTAGGNITVGSAGGDVTARNAGGNITVGSAGGKATVQTAGGSIRLSKCAGPVRAETAAGSILARIAASRGAWAESLLETSAGDIAVFLPEDLAVTIRAVIEQATARHGITSEFPLTLRSTSEAPGPREVLAEGTINGGGALLRLRTISGNIEIKKNR